VSIVKLALAQTMCRPGRDQNLAHGLRLISRAAEQGAHLICFPEVSFDTFFPQYRADRRFFTLGESMDGTLVEKIKLQVASTGVAVVFNMYERARAGEYYDCSPVFDNTSELLGKSRMMHIAESPGYNEKYYYREGNTGYPVYSTQFAGRVGVAICYDRHFPEHMRALTLGGAEIILVPTATASLEEDFQRVWEVEMQGAAIANQVFIAVVNRVGPDDTLTFFGGSFVVNPRGQIVARASRTQEELLFVDCDLDLIEQARQEMPFLRDRRPETYGVLARTGEETPGCG
jgi:predicted amidohydrolase